MNRHGLISAMMISANMMKHVRTGFAYDHPMIREE